ncbi:MAG: SPOR domain-containing protein [Porphyromonadaceae bacterium]|nr:MAG: SPOR domain-containing protein [Porphyromonadaceae bacterium]
MKSNGLKILILLGFLIPSTLFESKGQVASLQGFSLKVSPGALVYYGDLSTNNLNIPKRIITGSKFGVGAGIIKQFSPFFGIQAQFLAGSLYTSAPDNTYFAGSLTEFSLSARFDPIRLWKGKSFKLSPYASVGVATFSFRSVRREMYTNVVLLPNFGYNIDGVTKANKQTAMSMPISIGLSYQIMPNLQVELEHSLRMTNTDLLDCFKGPSTANDLYSLTSIGLRFTIPTPSTGNIEQTNALNNAPVVKTDKATEVTKTDIPEINVFVDCEIPETIQVGQTFDVKVRVNKGNYTGPAKLIQKYPDGFTVLDDLTRSHLFSFTNQNLIMEWEQLPADSTVTYNYQVKVGGNLTGSQTITGKFEYQQPDGAKTVRFNKSIFIDNQKQADEKEISINQLLKQYDSGESAKAAPVAKGNIKQSQPLAGIEFRVQCGAFRYKSQADTYLAVKYSITEIIQEEYADNWYKYTVGSFRTYKEAARYRESFIARTGILSAFIVAYKDGHRLANINDAFR